MDNYVVIKPVNLFESLENTGLVCQFNYTFRIWFHTGTAHTALQIRIPLLIIPSLQ